MTVETLTILICLLSLTINGYALWITRSQHRTTDPACKKHKRPRTPWARWRYERGRGRPCHVCRPPTITYARNWLGDNECSTSE